MGNNNAQIVKNNSIMVKESYPLVIKTEQFTDDTQLKNVANKQEKGSYNKGTWARFEGVEKNGFCCANFIRNSKDFNTIPEAKNNKKIVDFLKSLEGYWIRKWVKIFLATNLRLIMGGSEVIINFLRLNIILEFIPNFLKYFYEYIGKL